MRNDTNERSSAIFNLIHILEVYIGTTRYNGEMELGVQAVSEP